MESIIEGYGYRLELGDWPLVVVRYPAHPPDPVTGYRWLFERYAELCARGTGIAWLVDFALANPLAVSARHRKTTGRVFAEHEAALRAATLCEARVVRGPFARGVLTSFDAMTRAGWPRANFATEPAARRWIAEQSARRRR